MIQCVGKVFEACCHHPYFREFNVGNYPTNKDPPRFCNVSNTLQLELLRYPKLVWTLSDNSTIGCQCPQVILFQNTVLKYSSSMHIQFVWQLSLI